MEIRFSHFFLAASVIAICAASAGCATSSPIPWRASPTDARQAVAQVRVSSVKECVWLVATGPRALMIIKSDTFPQDRYTLLALTPRDVLSAIASAFNQRVMPGGQERGMASCKRVAVSLRSVAHGIAQGGLGSEEPYVCVKIRLSLLSVRSKKAVYFGSASGSVLWWAARDSRRMFEDYNRTAYLALARSIANGLRDFWNEEPLPQRGWPKCLFHAFSIIPEQ